MLWILTKDPVTFTALSSISTQSPSTWCNSGMFWGNSEMILSKNLNLINKMFFKQISFTSHLRSVAQDELNAADQEKMIGIAILSFISLVTLVFYFFVKNALSVIRVKLQNLWCRPFKLAANKSGFCQRSDGKGQRVRCGKNEDRESLSWFSTDINCQRHEEKQGNG